jgi:hypothetical protein
MHRQTKRMHARTYLYTSTHIRTSQKDTTLHTAHCTTVQIRFPMEVHQLPCLNVGVSGVHRGGGGQIDKQTQSVLVVLRARVHPKVAELCAIWGLDKRIRLNGLLAFLTGLPRTTVGGQIGRLKSRMFLPRKPKNQGVVAQFTLLCF